MPIYEFICNMCKNEYSDLVKLGEHPHCPQCGSQETTKKFSVFSVGKSNSPKKESCKEACAPQGLCASDMGMGCGGCSHKGIE